MKRITDTGTIGTSEVLIAIISEVAVSDGDAPVTATKLWPCAKSEMGQQPWSPLTLAESSQHH